MDFKEESEGILESEQGTTSQLMDLAIVKEEYVINESISEIKQEFVKFEIREIDTDIDEKNCKCFVCEKTFKLAFQLKKHMITHSSERNFQCGQCPKSYKRKDCLKDHLTSHIKKPVQCHICYRTIENPLRLKAHIRRQHTKVQPRKGANEICHECGKGFKSKIGLSMHIKRLHETDEKPGICPVCGKFIQHEFQRHFMSHKDLNCYICFRKFHRKRNLFRHVGTHDTEKPFACQICHKTFRLESYVRDHSKIHIKVKEEPMDCIYCGKSFEGKTRLNSHMKLYHRGFPRNPGATPACSICKKVCRDLEDLKEHVTSHPIGTNRFECSTCGITTKQKCLLLKHIQRVHLKVYHHKDAERIECPICSKKYARQNMKAHINTHSENRLFPCEICKNFFKTKLSLRNHQISMHTSTKKRKDCFYCKKNCNTKSGLAKHMRSIHSGLPINPSGPPFRCTVCKETHKTIDDLKKHVVIHCIDIKCAICGRKYYRKRLLQIHMERVHLKERPKKEKSSEKEQQEPCQSIETLDSILDIQDIKVEVENT